MKRIISLIMIVMLIFSIPTVTYAATPGGISKLSMQYEGFDVSKDEYGFNIEIYLSDDLTNQLIEVYKVYKLYDDYGSFEKLVNQIGNIQMGKTKNKMRNDVRNILDQIVEQDYSLDGFLYGAAMSYVTNHLIKIAGNAIDNANQGNGIIIRILPLALAAEIKPQPEPSSAPIPEKVKIKATVSSNQGGTVSGGGTFSAGTSTQVTAYPKSGWKFDGWYENNSRVNQNAAWRFNATCNMTLEARFSKEGSGPTPVPSKPKPALTVKETVNNSYSVVIPANTTVYGFSSSTSASKVTLYTPRSTTLTLSCTKRLTMSDGSTRYLFRSGGSTARDWYLDFTKSMSVTDLSTPEGRTVKIQYNANGGSGAPSSHTATAGENGVVYFNLSSIHPTKPGYNFVGWRLENDSAYDINRPGQGISIQLSNPTLTYYAQWQDDFVATSLPKPSASVSGSNVSVSWNTISGSNQLDLYLILVDEGTVNGTILDKVSAKNITSHTFRNITDGKYSVQLTTNLYTQGMVGEKVTFTIGSYQTLTVSYNANGGSGAPANDTVIYGEKYTVSSTIPTRVGYTFQGWASNPKEPNYANVSPGITYYDMKNDLTLNAVWKEDAPSVDSNPVDVTFYSYQYDTDISTKGDSLGGTDPGRMEITFIHFCEAKLQSNYNINSVDFVLLDSGMNQLAKTSTGKSNFTYRFSIFQTSGIDYNMLESSKTGHWISDSPIIATLEDGETYYWKVIVNTGNQQVASPIQSFTYKAIRW